MEEPKDERDTSETPAPASPPRCSCVTDPFSDLPPELRPHARKTEGDLRKVTCPGCGLVYWTNRKMDLCIECGKKDVHLPGD